MRLSEAIIRQSRNQLRYPCLNARFGGKRQIYHSVVVLLCYVDRKLVHLNSYIADKLLPCRHLPQIKRQLLAFKDIPISTSTLARSASNNSIQTTIGKLTLNSSFKFTQGLTRSQLSFHLFRFLNRFSRFSFGIRSSLTSTSAFSDRAAIEGFIIVTEGGSVDLHDSRFGESVGTDQLVVAGMIGCLELAIVTMQNGSVVFLKEGRGWYSDDSCFLGYTFRRPAEISAVQSQCSEFSVSTTDTDFMDTFCADTGVCWLATEFKLSLFAVRGTLCSSCCTLMAGVTRDTHPVTTVSTGS